MKIIAFDVETTGLDPDMHEIIEIAAVDIEQDGTIAATHHSLVRARDPIPPHISGITSIIDTDLDGCPAADEIVPALLGRADVLVAHNMAFDSKFVSRWVRPDARLVCTYRLGMRRWPDAENHKLQTLRYLAGLIEIPGFERRFLDGAHSALPDAVVCAGLFGWLLAETADGDVDRLVADTAAPLTITRLRFGKHAGQLLRDVPGDYLAWLSRNATDEIVGHSARAEIKRRAGGYA